MKYILILLLLFLALIVAIYPAYKYTGVWEGSPNYKMGSLQITYFGGWIVAIVCFIVLYVWVKTERK
jgi:hypothetical protein